MTQLATTCAAVPSTTLTHLSVFFPSKSDNVITTDAFHQCCPCSVLLAPSTLNSEKCIFCRPQADHHLGCYLINLFSTRLVHACRSP
eukprot:4565418-Amphidinium_carterae.1